MVMIIEGKKVISVKGEARIRIITLHGILPKHELPEEYLDGECVYSRDDGRSIVFRGAKSTFMRTVRETLTESQFNDMVTQARVCGARLKAINAARQELAHKWSGTISVKI